MAEQLPVTGSSARPDLSLAVIVGVGGIGMATTRRRGPAPPAPAHRFRPGPAGGTLRHQLCEEGFDMAAHPCDITDAGQAAELAAQVEERGAVRRAGARRRAVAQHGLGSADPRGEPGWRARHVEQAMRPLARKGTAAVFVSSLAAQFAAPSAEVMAILDDALAGFFQGLEAQYHRARPTLWPSSR